jgi:hypothetical protein
MRKYLLPRSLLLVLGTLLVSPLQAQKAGLRLIDIPDLETHMAILASDEYEGRATGEPGLDKAAGYLASQAREMGLKAIDENGDYFQEYTLVNKKYDPADSYIKIKSGSGPETILDNTIYLINPDSNVVDLSGEVVFAGYGISSGADSYNDFVGIEPEGKIVLIMNRGPMDESGKVNLLSNRDWSEFGSFRYKMPGLLMRMPKAILFVMDPKSGDRSLLDASPQMARFLNRTRYVKELGNNRKGYMPEIGPKLIMVHSDVADEILKSSSKTLAELQESIDGELKPVSFELPGVSLDIRVTYSLEEKVVPNVAGLIEGNDPELKNEVILYTAHFDHLGTKTGDGIYNGADDNASGTVALLEIGEAFMAERDNLRRSVLILWVSGEEIGLFGSKFYSEFPIVPLEHTVANLNLDMVGAVRTVRDKGMIYGEQVSVMGMDSIGLIGGVQSSDLKRIHNRMTSRLGMITDEKFNDPDHPYRYYYRSDHINFARHDIPVLFYSTGIHIDYHKVTDNYDRIHFPKLKKVSELSFLVGYELATRKKRIAVDNPFSHWGRPYYQ